VEGCRHRRHPTCHVIGSAAKAVGRDRTNPPGSVGDETAMKHGASLSQFLDREHDTHESRGEKPGTEDDQPGHKFTHLNRHT
jgi:hypothetical protein